MKVILLAVAVLGWIGYLKYKMTAAVLLLHIQKNGCSEPSNEEIKHYTQQAIKDLFK